MSTLTLAQASTIVDKALEKGRELKLHPLTVVVLDAGGHLVAMKREDKSGILRTEIGPWVSPRRRILVDVGCLTFCDCAGLRRTD